MLETIDPVHGLLFAGGSVLLAALLFWPVRGLAFRAWRALEATGRVRAEDALKHLYDRECHKSTATLHSLAGALSVSGKRAAEVFAGLQRMEMIVARGDGYALTDRGRREALRVVRLHRLWERYLSEETGLGAEEWHREAERREHRTTPEQAADLAARMGFPRFDPHGDPIPTEEGEVIRPDGVPLHALRPGSCAEIVHVEDEPSAVYAQLVAAGLYPGMRVDMIESDARRVRLRADGRQHDLTPVLAANLTVREIAGPGTDEPGTEALSALSPGERASVTAISPACHGPERGRLLDLGIVPDTVVEAELVSPSGDPTAYRVRGALIALRREQASLIRVRRIDREATA